MFAHRLKGLAQIRWRMFAHGLDGWNRFIFEITHRLKGLGRIGGECLHTDWMDLIFEIAHRLKGLGKIRWRMFE